jgi:hypothetical protein
METIEVLVQSLEKLSENLKANPTVIYNEGWMVRLLIYQSNWEGLTLTPNIRFGTKEGEIKNWTSEALIDSPFMGKELKDKKQNETHTHADVMLGDFSVCYSKNGAITVKPDAKILGIVEAKMGSGLSRGITNADNYNQASRSIACLSYNVIKESKKCDIFFIIVVR